MSRKQWNPDYLSGIVRHAIELLPKESLAIDLFLKAAEHLECTEKYACKEYRRILQHGVTQLRRMRRIEPWEYWLLSAGKQILQPIPGTKHAAVGILGSAIDEYDSTKHRAWHEWCDQHTEKEPAYV